MDSWSTNRRSLARATGSLMLMAGLALACTDAPTEPAPTYTVGGTVSGLSGSGLVLRDNGGDNLAVPANGPVTFSTPLASGTAYNVSVLTQPISPAQICIVTSGRGTIASANVTTVAIGCAASTHTVGGTVTGLAGSGLVLRDNGGDDLAVSRNGPITFSTPLASGTAYNVTVLTQPISPAQVCIVTGGRGTMASSNVTTVAIACTIGTPPLYTVGGTVTGLAGSGLVLRNNGGDDLPVTGNGPITFAAKLASGAAYNVTALTQPSSPAQSCVVTGGAGTVASANITTVAITCTTNGTNGILRLTVATTGPDAPATDTVGVDPGSSEYYTAVAPSNGMVSLTLTPGAHTVNLTVAPNCTVTTPNFVSVTVAAGATADIAFSVTCVANGTLGVTVVSSGSNIPATYTVFADLPNDPTAYHAAVPANGTVSFTVASGDHTVFLSVARNCTVTSSNSVPVTVAAGAPTDVAFRVTCGPLGTIQVTVATTGTNAPATYRVEAVDVWYYNRNGGSVPSNGTISLSVLPGTYSVKLTVPFTCRVSGAPPQGRNPQSVGVESGATASVSFGVTCGPPATLRVTAATTGPSAPEAYTVGVDPVGYGGYRYSASVSSNGTVSQTLPAGQHTVKLLEPLNCTVTSPNNVSVTLTSGATTDLGFTVACQ